MKRTPVIAVTTDHVTTRSGSPACEVYTVYSDAVIHAVGGLPWLLPPAGPALDSEALMERIDGILFTGARSDIQPRRYHGAPAAAGAEEDPDRDDTTLPLIPKLKDGGVPMLCICRGTQELNVALGGSLHQDVPALPGKLPHFPPQDWPVAKRFALAHEVRLEEGGALRRLSGASAVEVNSVHRQGIDRLAADLEVEARAPDGIIEAVRVKSSQTFALGVQWHPEWDWREHPLNAAIWRAFGEACRDRAEAR